MLRFGGERGDGRSVESTVCVLSKEMSDCRGDSGGDGMRTMGSGDGGCRGWTRSVAANMLKRILAGSLLRIDREGLDRLIVIKFEIGGDPVRLPRP